MANRTFLQLVNRLRQDAGISGPDLSTLQGTLTKEAQRCKNWINDVWEDVQTAHTDWQWMRKSASFVTIAGQAVYRVGTEILIDDLNEWDRESFKNYPTTTGNRAEIEMTFRAYDPWRHVYQLGANRYTQSRPNIFTETPEKNIGLGPVPADGYTVTCDYYAKQSALVDDDDRPNIPEQYERVIIYGAMIKYGLFEVAQEVLAAGEKGFKDYMRRLQITRMKKISLGGAIA